jgi:hypothetical protein
MWIPFDLKWLIDGGHKIKINMYVRPQQELSHGTLKYENNYLSSAEKKLTSKTDKQQTSMEI